MSDRWRADTWNQGDGWPVTTVQCTICGELRRVFPLRLHAPLPNRRTLEQWKRDHMIECPYPVPGRCPEVMTPDAVPVIRCILGEGHPVGPEYTWFTDWLGHIWEVP